MGVRPGVGCFLESDDRLLERAQQSLRERPTKAELVDIVFGLKADALELAVIAVEGGSHLKGETMNQTTL